MWASNAKEDSTQISLPNGSLEQFSKYIYHKPMDRELLRRNVLDTVILFYRMTAGNI